MTRTALITGAGGGLAQATARLLAEAGWSLALVGRDRAALTAVHAELAERAPDPGESIKIVLVRADVSTGEGAVQAVQTARKLMEQPLTNLVNCAGGLVHGTTATTSERDRGRLATANLDTGFYMLGAFLDQALADQIRGSVVLVDSLAEPSRPRRRATTPASAPAHLEDLVDSAAATYAPHGLRVNAVAPEPLRSSTVLRGFGSTPAGGKFAEQCPLGRWSDVLEPARAIRWLLTEDAAWVTGQVLPVEGCRTVREAPLHSAATVAAS